jgi:hypothetical protein
MVKKQHIWKLFLLRDISYHTVVTTVSSTLVMSSRPHFTDILHVHLLHYNDVLIGLTPPSFILHISTYIKGTLSRDFSPVVLWMFYSSFEYSLKWPRYISHLEGHSSRVPPPPFTGFLSYTPAWDTVLRCGIQSCGVGYSPAVWPPLTTTFFCLSLLDHLIFFVSDDGGGGGGVGILKKITQWIWNFKMTTEVFINTNPRAI